MPHLSAVGCGRSYSGQPDRPYTPPEAIDAGHRLFWRIWFWTKPWPSSPLPWSSLTPAGSRCPEAVAETESRGLDVDGG